MRTREIDAQQVSSIPMLKSLRKGKVFVMEDKDIIIIKKTPPLFLSEIRNKLKNCKGEITEREINREVQRYRQEK